MISSGLLAAGSPLMHASTSSSSSPRRCGSVCTNCSVMLFAIATQCSYARGDSSLQSYSNARVT